MTTVATQPCDTVATEFGGCADCHAPAINGRLGGRDLLEATDFSYDYGVHCDFCHESPISISAPKRWTSRYSSPSEVIRRMFGGGYRLHLGRIMTSRIR